MTEYLGIRFASLRLVVLAGLGCLIAACGGGGGGSGPASSSSPPPAPPPPPPPPPALTRAVLTSLNTTQFTELVREVIYFELSELQQSLLTLGNRDFPEPNLTDFEGTEDCLLDGTTSIVLLDGGRDITFSFSDCSDSAGESIDGSVRFLFSNLDEAAGTYQFRIFYSNLTQTFDGPVVILDGETVIYSTVSGSDHTHRIEADLTSTQIPGYTIRVENFVATVHHVLGADNDLEPYDIVGMTGEVGPDVPGVVELQFLPASNEVRMTGASGTEAFFTIDGTIYSARHVEPGGRLREIIVTADRLSELSTSDNINDPPQLEGLTSHTLFAGTPLDLDYRLTTFDPDFEFLDFVLEITDGPNGATFFITQERDGLFELDAENGGSFTATLTVSDGFGGTVADNFALLVSADTDGDGEYDDMDEDDDDDGVEDVDDVFPFNASEWRDADGDNVGDNADTDDDNDGVLDVDDVFPFNAACASVSDPDAATCWLTSVTDFDGFTVDANRVLYFGLFEEKLIHRWDTASEAPLEPWVLGDASTESMTAILYHPGHDRIYVGYDTGDITFIDPAVEVETTFHTLGWAVSALADAGNFLYAQGRLATNDTNYVISVDGVPVGTPIGGTSSADYVYSASQERLYYTYQDQQVIYRQIDQSTGEVLTRGESPYNGEYEFAAPLVLSPGEGLVLAGSGTMIRANDMMWDNSIPIEFADAIWSAADGLVAIGESGGQTVLKRHDAALAVTEQIAFDGEPVALVKLASGYRVVSRTGQGLLFHDYAPSDDSDGDTVLNADDAFPLDPAAAVDADRDGYPDDWNPGMSDGDSTTGLALDAYTNNSACYLPEHGDGLVCNIESTLPDYRPDWIAADADGTIYLLSAANNRVYRYSGETQAHLPPIVVGTNTTVTVEAPEVMEYSPAHDRLYFGYESGAITFVDLNEATLAEQSFTATPEPVKGLGAAGDFLLAQDQSFNTSVKRHQLFDQTGNLTHTELYASDSRDYQWNETLQRLYHFRDYTFPNDIQYHEISLTGQIVDTTDSPYHGDYAIAPPIVLSPDEQQVLIGSGDIYEAPGLTRVEFLANGFVSGIWDANGNVTTARDVGGATRIDRYDAALNATGGEDHAGEPLALTEHASGYLLVTYDGAEPVFTPIAR
jgi:hypothetical protein